MKEEKWRLSGWHNSCQCKGKSQRKSEQLGIHLNKVRGWLCFAELLGLYFLQKHLAAEVACRTDAAGQHGNCSQVG